MSYAELATTTNFSFLRGASHPEELVAEALRLGHAGIGIADRNTVAGVVRAHAAVREAGARGAEFRLAVGARLVFSDGTPDILAYPATRAGWGRLCRMLTTGNLRSAKGECILSFEELAGHADDLLLAVIPRDDDADEDIERLLGRLCCIAPGAVWLAAAMTYRGKDRRRLAHLKSVAAAARVPLLAINDVLYHSPERRPLQDVASCIREKLTIETAGRRLEANAERHLKPPEEMVRLFADAPEAVGETIAFLDRVRFSLDMLSYEYPDEPVPPGMTPQQHLEALTWEHARARYPQGIPEKVRTTLAKELALIAQLNYAPYFLSVHDIVQFANSRGILCQGRGSAANSSVCYVLGITAVDPEEIDLLFERFVSAERKEPPDIDVDFEHERREEVIQYIYERYGRDRAGIAATVITYRSRSAIREVGKALGLTEDVTAALARTVQGSWGESIFDSQIREAGLDPQNPLIRRVLNLATELLGFPRHLSQHVGGFVLTRNRLDETVPIANAAMVGRTFIEWDKDDLDTLGLLKVDVLALGMLTCIRKAFALIEQHHGVTLDLSSVPRDDPAVYAMLQRGDSLGTFQVESRAQMNMLPRLKPACFYDLVIEVAIVRPGPIQGDMVHPYLRRRQGIEPVEFPSPSPEHGPRDELHQVLGRTLGVPLFQEQAMRLAIVAAQFTPDEADGLRRAMATFRRAGTIHTFFHKFVDRMTARGYEREFAIKCFKQIEGFGTYGFPESHAAAFARLAYVSSWLKCHYPAVFACALLNSQPMGFYAPAQIVRDAREHGVEVRAVDINASVHDNSLEPQENAPPALRLGFRQIDGFRAEWSQRIVADRLDGYPSVEELARRTHLPRRALELLADADAFCSIRLNRRNALWAVRRLPDAAPLPLFATMAAPELPDEADVELPLMPLSEDVAADYQTLRLSLKAHPMQFLRELFHRENVLSCADTVALPDGKWTRTAGVVLVRQRPGTASGVIFMTIEDESGITNVVVWPKLTERFRRVVMGARLILIDGRIQRSPEGVVHLVAQRLYDRTHELRRLSEASVPELPLLRADESIRPERAHVPNHPRNERIIPKSRDFH